VRDQFFRAPPNPPPPPTTDDTGEGSGEDSEPNYHIEVPDEVIEYWRREFVPRWHISAEGPVPFGSTDNVQLMMEYVTVETRGEAEEAMWTFIRHMCELWRRDFDEDEWNLVEVEMRGPKN
jgi:hypothetical protein